MAVDKSVAVDKLSVVALDKSVAVADRNSTTDTISDRFPIAVRKLITAAALASAVAVAVTSVTADK